MVTKFLLSLLKKRLLLKNIAVEISAFCEIFFPKREPFMSLFTSKMPFPPFYFSLFDSLHHSK